jgi:hypothetical protein
MGDRFAIIIALLALMFLIGTILHAIIVVNILSVVNPFNPYNLEMHGINILFITGLIYTTIIWLLSTVLYIFAYVSSKEGSETLVILFSLGAVFNLLIAGFMLLAILNLPRRILETNAWILFYLIFSLSMGIAQILMGYKRIPRIKKAKLIVPPPP